MWPGESHGLYSPWGHRESDMTERLSLFFWKWDKFEMIDFGFKYTEFEIPVELLFGKSKAQIR